MCRLPKQTRGYVGQTHVALEANVAHGDLVESDLEGCGVANVGNGIGQEIGIIFDFI